MNVGCIEVEKFENDDGSILIINDKMDMEMSVRKRFLEAEGQAQNPNFISEKMSRPASNTRQQLQDEVKAHKLLEELDRRSREYQIEQATKRQAKRIQKSASLGIEREVTVNGFDGNENIPHNENGR